MTDGLDTLMRGTFPPVAVDDGAAARIVSATMARAQQLDQRPDWRHVLQGLIRPGFLLRYAMPMAAAALCGLVFAETLAPRAVSPLDSYSVFAAGYQ